MTLCNVNGIEDPSESEDCGFHFAEQFISSAVPTVESSIYYARRSRKPFIRMK